MSQRRERIEERYPAAKPLLGVVDVGYRGLQAWYHVLILLALTGYMLWIRVRNWDRFVQGGQVLFSGNDPWYHLRQTAYTVRNWPFTMPFDPWTNFPQGTFVGQFGTLFDQIVATAALIVGLGSPSDQTIALTLLFAPAVFGALVALPTYVIGKRFAGKLGGLLAVALLALTPGSFVYRSVVGRADHHVAEVFFQVLAVAAILVALAVAEREKPVYEQFADRDWAGIRRPVTWGAVAGLAVTLYIWTWPPGVLLIGVIGVFLALSLVLLYVRGESPEHVAVAGAVSMTVAAILTLLHFDTVGVTATEISLLQPGLALAVAIGCVFLAWLAREWDARSLSTAAYPVAVAVIAVVLAAFVAVVFSDLFSYGVGQIERVFWFGRTPEAGTVGEVQPPIQTSGPLGTVVDRAVTYLAGQFGLAFYTAAAGAVLMLGRALFAPDDENRAGYLFVLVWFVMMMLATFTQARFGYYLLVPITAMNAFLLGQVVTLLGPADIRSGLVDFDAYQVLALVSIVLLVTTPLVVVGQEERTVGEYADGASYPGGGIQGWDGALGWMQNNTPAEGEYGGADNQMEYYGDYERTGNFEYPQGAYGVMSWWDYGHWITSVGERIPVANPFQQHATEAANYLLAGNESIANDRLATEGSGTRYVMVDWKMADPGSRTKFFAPVVFANQNDTDHPDSEYRAPIYNTGGQFQFMAPNQRYYETMIARLYQYHGSAVETAPVVLDYQSSGTNDDDSLRYGVIPNTRNATPVKRFQNMSAARAFVEEDGSARIGGVGRFPQERVPALEHYRLVDASERSGLESTQLLTNIRGRLRATGLRLPGVRATPQAWTKTFERVPGANVTGTGPANETVTASARMQMGAGRTFTYTQQATTDSQGNFEMTLPYSTTGYDSWGTDEGYTNVSVRATGPYTVQTGALERNETSVTVARANLSVPEGAVLDENDTQLAVDLATETIQIPQANNTTVNASANGTTTNTTSDNATGDNATSDNATGDNANGTTTSADTGGDDTAQNASTGNGTDATTSNASALAPPTLAPPALARPAATASAATVGVQVAAAGATRLAR